jgi:hypothetical protein
MLQVSVCTPFPTGGIPYHYHAVDVQCVQKARIGICLLLWRNRPEQPGASTRSCWLSLIILLLRERGVGLGILLFPTWFYAVYGEFRRGPRLCHLITLPSEGQRLRAQPAQY